jgi:hypothetical protein
MFTSMLLPSALYLLMLILACEILVRGLKLDRKAYHAYLAHAANLCRSGCSRLDLSNSSDKLECMDSSFNPCTSILLASRSITRCDADSISILDTKGSIERLSHLSGIRKRTSLLYIERAVHCIPNRHTV